MTTRPYFRHTIDQLEAMPADATLIAELELRTTPRARKLLAKLKAGTATAPKIDASPVPAPAEKREPVTKGKRPAKGIARPRAVQAPVKRKGPKWWTAQFGSKGALDGGTMSPWSKGKAYEAWYLKKFGREFDPATQYGCDGYVERDATTGKIRVAAGIYGKMVDERENAPADLPIAA